MAGFGNAKEGWAERSLEKTSRELKALRNVIEKYKDDPKGRKKMMKKMKGGGMQRMMRGLGSLGGGAGGGMPPGMPRR